jgi:hypothetical protein
MAQMGQLGPMAPMQMAQMGPQMAPQMGPQMGMGGMPIGQIPMAAMGAMQMTPVRCAAVTRSCRACAPADWWRRADGIDAAGADGTNGPHGADAADGAGATADANAGSGARTRTQHCSAVCSCGRGATDAAHDGDGGHGSDVDDGEHSARAPRACPRVYSISLRLQSPAQQQQQQQQQQQMQMQQQMSQMGQQRGTAGRPFPAGSAPSPSAAARPGCLADRRFRQQNWRYAPTRGGRLVPGAVPPPGASRQQLPPQQYRQQVPGRVQLRGSSLSFDAGAAPGVRSDVDRRACKPRRP